METIRRVFGVWGLGLRGFRVTGHMASAFNVYIGLQGLQGFKSFGFDFGMRVFEG